MSLLIKPIITEKSMAETAKGRFSFKVLKGAKKPEIKRAVESQFGVKVRGVQTLVYKGERKRNLRNRARIVSSDWKKAIVSLAEGQKIDLFESDSQGGKSV